MYQLVPSPFEPAFAGSIQACYTSTDWGGSGFGFFFHNQNGLEWNFKVSIWVFPKIGVPQNGWFIIEIPY